jgi:hypothetical protein
MTARGSAREQPPMLQAAPEQRICRPSQPASWQRQPAPDQADTIVKRRTGPPAERDVWPGYSRRVASARIAESVPGIRRRGWFIGVLPPTGSACIPMRLGIRPDAVRPKPAAPGRCGGSCQLQCPHGAGQIRGHCPAPPEGRAQAGCGATVSRCRSGLPGEATARLPRAQTRSGLTMSRWRQRIALASG